MSNKKQDSVGIAKLLEGVGIKEIVKNAVKSTVGDKLPAREKTEGIKEAVLQVSPSSAPLSEAIALVPKTYNLKTEQVSATTKQVHASVYNNQVSSFNNISSRLDTVQRQETKENNSANSEFRRLKRDESSNFNGIKLHELYFSNISDAHSEIRQDSIPFMRLVRDWGTFEQWQLDFRTSAMNAEEGWVVLFFDPYKQKYFNCFVEGNTEFIPLCGIPVLVIDTHHHAWFRDYPGEKLEYLNSQMNEINWTVVEARMLIAEMAQLHKLYMIEPVGVTDTPRTVNIMPTFSAAPIESDRVLANGSITSTEQPASFATRDINKGGQ